MSDSLRSAIGAFIFALLSLYVFLNVGGGAYGKAPVGIADPGVLVGWGFPALKVATDVVGIVVIGFLLAAAFLLPSDAQGMRGLSVRAVVLASRWAYAWVVLSVLYFFFKAANDGWGEPLWELDWAEISGYFGTSNGRAPILQAVGALVVAVLARYALTVRSVAVALGVAVASLAPVALTGHTASSGSHDLATTSMLMHLIGAGLWVGGLAALGWVALHGSKRLAPAVARYSSIALWSFVIVGVSGALNASVRLTSWSDLVSQAYGQLLLGKIVALIALGVFGQLQRRRIAAGGGGFVRLALTELFVMAATVGLSVALSRTPPPVEGNLLSTRAEQLLGGPLPEPPSVINFITGWSGNGVGLVVVGLGTALYLKGVWTLRKRGDSWPVGRTISWLVGMLTIAWATFGGLGEYSHVLFSAHMASHMLLSMVAPIFLALAAPMTLALRALPGPRQPGEVSPRGLLTAFLHSGYSRFMTHPLVGPILFIGSLYGLYFTGLFEALMNSHLGHAAMEIHFLAVGFLFYYVLIGVDPSPRALNPLARFGALLVTLPFHAFFATGIMSSNTVIALSYWKALDRPYQSDLLADQYLGSGMAWAMGEIPLVLVMIALLVQWFRSDMREAKRFDRKEERNDDAALEAYNAHLRDLAEHGKRRNPDQ
jgi:cytochrome c oxidase assembly factor CtaG